jgi:2-dehydro-3-deoxyphosphogluconate aldolase/(4S)-4-hydroxy-2-oxoglutarate aldolase
MNLIQQLSQTKVIPVVKLKSAERAVGLAEALAEGGLRAAEITFRTDAAEESIRRIAKSFPDFLLAAGTVLNTENADRAMDAGASLIVSPGLNPKVVEHCLKKGYPVMPGVCTPTEVELAMSFGLENIKFFPAEAMGGVKTLKALSAPYGNVKFMPTGGVDEKNVMNYLALPCVLCCGGSWMVKGDWIDEGNFDVIAAKTKEAVAVLKGE